MHRKVGKSSSDPRRHLRAAFPVRGATTPAFLQMLAHWTAERTTNMICFSSASAISRCEAVQVFRRAGAHCSLSRQIVRVSESRAEPHGTPPDDSAYMTRARYGMAVTFFLKPFRSSRRRAAKSPSITEINAPGERTLTVHDSYARRATAYRATCQRAYITVVQFTLATTARERCSTEAPAGCVEDTRGHICRRPDVLGTMALLPLEPHG